MPSSPSTSVAATLRSFRAPGAWAARDALLLFGLRACALLSGVVLLLIVVFVVGESWPALREIGPARFLGDRGWHPVGGTGSFGLGPMVLATLLSSFGAIFLATLVGVGCAVWCQFYAGLRAAGAVRRIVELLAGIPSVVYGLWGLVVLVPLLLQIAPPGQNLLAGILILAIMILPTVALFADAALSAVPAHTIAGARALALPRHVIAWRIAVPAARGGITTAVLLAAGRAIGETMAVLMVCGNVVQMPSSLFDPVRTLTANIALEMGYALADHRSALFVSGLLLLALVAALVLGANRVRGVGRV